MHIGKTLKTTTRLTALVTVAFSLAYTFWTPRLSPLVSRIALTLETAIVSGPAAAKPNAKRKFDNKTEYREPDARLESLQKNVSADSETQQLLLTLCAALNSGDTTHHDLALGEFIPALVRLDAVAAGCLAETWPLGSIRAELLRRVSQEWSKRDPTAAIEWAANLKDYGERMSALQDGCVQISQSDPEEGIALATHFKSDDGTVENIAQLWARKNIPAALAWTRLQSQGEQRDRLMAHIAFVKAETQPAEAARLVVTEIAPGEARDEAFISVLHQWGLADQAGAVAWLAGISDQPLRERAINELVGLARN